MVGWMEGCMHACVCMYVYMYVCMDSCLYVCVYICINCMLRMYVRTYVNTQNVFQGFTIEKSWQENNDYPYTQSQNLEKKNLTLFCELHKIQINGVICGLFCVLTH